MRRLSFYACLESTYGYCANYRFYGEQQTYSSYRLDTDSKIDSCKLALKNSECACYTKKSFQHC